MANPPVDVPDAAEDVTRDGVNETVDPEVLARNRRFYEKLMALKGKIKLDIDLDELRGRRRS